MNGLTLDSPEGSQLRVASFFSGLGGLDLGFVWEGFKVIWATDISTHAVESYRMNFGLEPKQADIDEINFESIGGANVVIGGPPCQAFSLVGYRRPDDPRGRLVFKFLEAVAKIRPQAFVMENVPGMAASFVNGVSLPEILTKSFTKLGYEVVQVHLVATNYLVPQLRKRFFLLGCINWKPEVPDSPLFAKQHYSVDVSKYDLSAKAAIGDLGPCTNPGERANYGDIEPSLFATLMRGIGSKSVSLHEFPRMSETDKMFVQHIPPGGNYMDIPDAISTPRILKFKQTGGRTTTYGRLHPDRPSFTINTYFRRPNVGSNFHYKEPRLITLREAMRFQSIPDHFEITRGPKDTRNALVGNAVPPLMAQAVAWSIKKALLNEPISQAKLR